MTYPRISCKMHVHSQSFHSLWCKMNSWHYLISCQLLPLLLHYMFVNMASPDSFIVQLLVNNEKFLFLSRNKKKQLYNNDFHFSFTETVTWLSRFVGTVSLSIDYQGFAETALRADLMFGDFSSSTFKQIVVLELQPSWYWRLFHIFPGCVLPQVFIFNIRPLLIYF